MTNLLRRIDETVARLKSLATAKDPRIAAHFKAEWEAATLLTELRAEVERDRWIPVSERLPECPRKRDSFGVPVMVYQPGNGERKVFEAFYGGRVTAEPNFYLYGALLDGVAAWQPLPPPPVRKEGGES